MMKILTIILLIGLIGSANAQYLNDSNTLKVIFTEGNYNALTAFQFNNSSQWLVAVSDLEGNIKLFTSNETGFVKLI